MWLYTFKRLLQGVVTVWFIATATFIAMHNVEEDAYLNCDSELSEEEYI
jgi:ABC-type dipeptide/oligopeptide/nickel transport system permease component